MEDKDGAEGDMDGGEGKGADSNDTDGTIPLCIRVATATTGLARGAADAPGDAQGRNLSCAAIDQFCRFAVGLAAQAPFATNELLIGTVDACATFIRRCSSSFAPNDDAEVEDDKDPGDIQFPVIAAAVAEATAAAAFASCAAVRGDIGGDNASKGI